MLDVVAWLCSRQSGLVRYGKCLNHVNVWSSDCVCYVAVFYWTVQAESKLKSVSTFRHTIWFMQFIGSVAFFPVNISSSAIDLLLKPCCLHHDRRTFVPFQLVNVGSFRLIYDNTNPNKRKSETPQTLSLCPKMQLGLRHLGPTSCVKVRLFTFLHAVLLQGLRQHWQDFSFPSTVKLFTSDSNTGFNYGRHRKHCHLTWSEIEKTCQSTSLLKPGCVPRLQIMKSKCVCLTRYHESHLHWDCIQSWDWTSGAVCTSVAPSFFPWLTLIFEAANLSLQSHCSRRKQTYCIDGSAQIL